MRKNLVETAGLVAVVSLPAGIFQPYAGVKTSILILDRRLAKQRDNILFVKIENDGYGLGAQRRAIPGEQLSEAKQVLREFFQSLEISNPKSEIKNSKSISLAVLMGLSDRIIRSLSR